MVEDLARKEHVGEGWEAKKVKVVFADREYQLRGGKGEVKLGTVSHGEPLQVLKQGRWLVSAMLCDPLG